MPQETELQIDDGTTTTSLQLQCGSCDASPYLEAGAKTVTTTELGEIAEYPYTCPTCGANLVVRVPQEVTA